MSYLSRQKYNRYRLSRWQVKRQEAERKRLELDEGLLIDVTVISKRFASILQPPVSELTEIVSAPDFLAVFPEWKEGAELKPFSDYVSHSLEKLLLSLEAEQYLPTLQVCSSRQLYDIKEDIRQITSAGRNNLTAKQALRLKNLLVELQEHIRKFVVKKRRKYNVIFFGRRTLRSCDQRAHIRKVSYGTGRFMHVSSDEEEVDNTVGIVLQLYSFKENEKACIMLNRYWPHLIRLSSRQKTG